MSTWQDYYVRRDRDRSWVKWPDEQIIRFVYRTRGQCSRNMRALDVGCGSGRHTLFMAREGFRVFGVDYSTKAVDITNRLLHEMNLEQTARISDITELPYEDNFFDLAVCWHTLYCTTLDRMRLGIKEMHRVLTPGGSACVSLRRTNDYTLGKGEQLEPNTFKLDPAQVSEDPGDMTVHYSDLDEAQELFSNFSSVEIGFSDFAFGNLEHVRSHWIVMARK